MLTINHYKFQASRPAPYKPVYMGNKDAFNISQVIGIEQFSLASGLTRYLGDEQELPANWIAA